MPQQSDDDGLLSEAYQRSVELLKDAATPVGFLASPAHRTNYHAVWGRDGSICATAAFLTEDDELLEAARNTLRTLAGHQAPNGQIPSYITVTAEGEIDEVIYGGLGEITTIDANLWFLIACQTALDMREEDEFIGEHSMAVYRKVMTFLSCVDSNSCGLLEIPTAGDWTDILTRSYHVLYDEVLWYRSLKCAASFAEAAGYEEEDQSFEARAEGVRARINEDFWWSERDTIERVCEKYMIKNELDKDTKHQFYQSHLEPFFNNWHFRFDAFANVLAALMGIAPRERAEQITDTVFERNLHKPYPLRILDPPIEEDDEDAYQLRTADEKPWDYHNGGIWALAGGFWAILLKLQHRDDDAREALLGIAKANRETKEDDGYDWGFYEYHHGKKHTPCGTPRLSWNAASYLIAHEALFNDKLACFARGTDFT